MEYGYENAYRQRNKIQLLGKYIKKNMNAQFRIKAKKKEKRKKKKYVHWSSSIKTSKNKMSKCVFTCFIIRSQLYPQA